LEVGTGFHPELTGRENIFLNGAILGMTKSEIKSKFDEIVDFAGVERYIDTPVKRYSSGMYVRLAFGVAAHLEPEILIVDEVLAVGDAEFQKKALGKMKEVSGKEGRTVLFVSHNLAAIKNICSTCILLNNGKIESYGNVDMVIESYFLQAKKAETLGEELLSKKQAFFLDWKILNGLDIYAAYSREVCEFCFDLIVRTEITNAEFGLVIRDFKGEIIYGSNSRDSINSFISLNPGKFKIIFKVSLPIRADLYEIDIAVVSQGKIIEQYVPANKLNIVSRLDTVLDDKWCGILNEKSIFRYDVVS
jgi:lipopolysaccharide transport system ATP-binding protein